LRKDPNTIKSNFILERDEEKEQKVNQDDVLEIDENDKFEFNEDIDVLAQLPLNHQKSNEGNKFFKLPSIKSTIENKEDFNKIMSADVDQLDDLDDLEEELKMMRRYNSEIGLLGQNTQAKDEK
jgi:hypothetical protein